MRKKIVSTGTGFKQKPESLFQTWFSKDILFSSQSLTVFHHVTESIKSTLSDDQVPVCLGASFRYSFEVLKQTDKLFFKPLAISGNCFKFKDNKLEFKGVSPANELAFRKHCTRFGVSPLTLLDKPHCFYDMSNSGSGIKSLDYLLKKWAKELLPKRHFQQFLEHLSFIIFQPIEAQRKYGDVSVLLGRHNVNVKSALKFPETCHESIAEICDNDINRVFERNPLNAFNVLPTLNTISSLKVELLKLSCINKRILNKNVFIK